MLFNVKKIYEKIGNKLFYYRIIWKLYYGWIFIIINEVNCCVFKFFKIFMIVNWIVESCKVVINFVLKI